VTGVQTCALPISFTHLLHIQTNKINTPHYNTDKPVPTFPSPWDWYNAPWYQTTSYQSTSYTQTK